MWIEFMSLALELSVIIRMLSCHFVRVVRCLSTPIRIRQLIEASAKDNVKQIKDQQTRKVVSYILKH